MSAVTEFVKRGRQLEFVEKLSKRDKRKRLKPSRLLISRYDGTLKFGNEETLRSSEAIRMAKWVLAAYTCKGKR